MELTALIMKNLVEMFAFQKVVALLIKVTLYQDDSEYQGFE